MGKNKHLSCGTIAQIVVLHQAGHSINEIVKLTSVGRTSVKKWVRKFKENEGQGLPTYKPRPGRKRKTGKRAITTVKRDIGNNPRITARKMKENNHGVFGEVSVRTVHRRINELGYTSHRPRKKPLLSIKQREKRVAFAHKYKQWDDETWLGVLWSDESVFSITDSCAGNVYRRPGSDPLDPRYLHSTIKHPDSLMVWGAFTGNGKAKLQVLPKNIRMNQNVYYELLCDHLPDAFEDTQAKIFQQDGAPCHTAKSICKWLQDCEVPYIKDWPGNSPDISPIENLLAGYKESIAGERHIIATIVGKRNSDGLGQYSS